MRSVLHERIVAHTWETQSFNPALLQQLNIRLVYRGLPSDAGGPDYQDALFAQEGKSLLRGDVEFHVLSSDWYNRGHHTDVAYDNVQLHVVWRDDRRPTVRHDGVEIPVLELCQDVNTGENNLDPKPFPRGCACACKHLAHEQIVERLRFAALERFDERVDRFEADAQSVGADQALYAAMFEALGYASNRRPFALLADAVPYTWLVSLPIGRARTCTSWRCRFWITPGHRSTRTGRARRMATEPSAPGESPDSPHTGCCRAPEHVGAIHRPCGLRPRPELHSPGKLHRNVPGFKRSG